MDAPKKSFQQILLETDLDAIVAKGKMENRKNGTLIVITIIVAIVIAIAATIGLRIYQARSYQSAIAAQENENFITAIELFKKAGNYKDSKKRLEELSRETILIGKGRGFGGEIVATITVQGGINVTKLCLECQCEILGTRLLPQLAETIVSSNSFDQANLDSISGATITGIGTLEAISNAVGDRDLVWSNAKITIVTDE